MPYADNSELPPAVRAHLPDRAQDIFRATFNAAFESHADDPDRETIAFRIAWAAVKRRYVKADDRWIARGARRSL